MGAKHIYITLFLVFTSIISYSQNDISKNSWFVSLDFGVQMSGIKSEDFISSNYSPVYKLMFGKWINSIVGIQAGYQGNYFNAIADNDKHFYNFYFVEGLLDVKNILRSNVNQNRFYELMFHGGFGYFQNQYYGNSTFHGILGASNYFSISERSKIKFDIGAIVGWDIYQGDEDILPNISLGIVYSL